MNLSGRRQAAVQPTDSGFSLVEVVVAVAIMGIVLALSVGGRSLIDNRRLVGAARTLATDMRWVEQRARTERLCWRIEFDPPGEHYHIQFLSGGSWTPAGGCPAGPWTNLRDVFFPSRIDLECTSFGAPCDSDVRWMIVSPFGNPNAGAVTLRTPQGEPRVVTVNVIGRITITR